MSSVRWHSIPALIAGSASLVRSSSHPGVAGVAYLPVFAGGTSCLALPAEDLSTRDVVEGIVLVDILIKVLSLRVTDDGA